MRYNTVPIRSHRGEPEGLAERLNRAVVGQEEAIDAIVPFVSLFEANLAPEGRPVGVFLLLGPTGTGKTRTVEALAEAVHGSEKQVLRVDCGEFQMEHEVAKLIGAPPGYLGHRETQPMITQQKLNSVTSERSGLSIVLFDEIEKAAISLGRLLLGILDKAQLKLGDNTTVNFERSLIFMTSNLGAREMMSEVSDGFGFAALAPRDETAVARKLQGIGVQAVKKRFSPEFVNRIDRTLTYRPLQREDCERILDLQLDILLDHIQRRLTSGAFAVELKRAAREFLLDHGTSAEYGARELKRAIHRHLVQPLAEMVIRKEVPAGGTVKVDCVGGELVPKVTAAGSGLRRVI